LNRTKRVCHAGAEVLQNARHVSLCSAFVVVVRFADGERVVVNAEIVRVVLFEAADPPEDN
jgi:hypothetical protein